jgi:hypothetical protein
MATIGNKFMNLLDVAKSTDKNGDVQNVVEILAQKSPIMMDAYATECNQGKEHLHTIRTGLPTVAWGALYQGIPQSKSAKQQVKDTTGFIEALSTVDKRLLDISKDPAALRLSEAKSFLEAMAQECDTAFFYHDTATTPEKIKGVSARYAAYDTAGTTSTSARQVIHAGGSGSDNTSIWFITWGEEFTSLIYPEGVPGGLIREDKGEQRVLDGSNNPYYVKEEMFTQHLGVAVRDWRYNARIANIDVSLAQAGSVKLYDYMRKAYYKLQSRRVPGGKQVIYMNRDMLEVLDALATNAGASDNFVRLQRTEIEGKEVLSYRGIPIHETDALLNNETLVPSV